MAAEARALLDELMGRSRNLDPSDNPTDLRWDDPDVCKHFLCAFCPHELFTNTRADLGPCNKIHDEALRKEYQKSTRWERLGYEEDFIRFLQTLVSDVEKRIRRGHQRLALNSQQGTLNGGPVNQNEEKITLLTEKINDLVVQAEELGCEGKVEEAQGVMKLADQLREERHELEKQPVQDDGGPLMKQMEVCDVCGAFLIVGDAPQRQDEHLMGKQHAGYAQVRAEIDKRKQKVRDEIEAREASEIKIRQEKEEREKERIREREEKRLREREREREKEKEKERERERRRKGRSRSRSRERHRSRSRDRRRKRSSSRDRQHSKRSSRSRDRERKGRGRSRSESKNSKLRRSSSRDRKSGRKRSRDRRSRSRNRSKEHRGKSRDIDDKQSNGRSIKGDEEPPVLTKEMSDLGNNDAVRSDVSNAQESDDNHQEKARLLEDADHQGIAVNSQGDS